jgi:CO/xanthine dehydrogenase FAD-binding subunit
VTVVVPTSLSGAIEALSDRPDADVLAGGTDFMVAVNEGRRRPTAVVCIRAVPELRTWDLDGDMVRIGAGVTYRELMEAPLSQLVPALAQAARTVGSPPIRNAGTIGGNLATASPAGDTLPVLAALGARVEVTGPAGTRRIGLADLVVGPKQTTLGSGELVTAVLVRAGHAPQEFLKVGVRNAMAIAVASLAMTVDAEARQIGIGLGSVGPVPLRAPDAERWLASAVDWDRLRLADRAGFDPAQLARLVRAAAQPIDDHRSTARYRTHSVGVLAVRAARRLFGEGTHGTRP